MSEAPVLSEAMRERLARLSPERRALLERQLGLTAPTTDRIAPRADRASAPLSAMQRFVWLVTQSTPGLYAYNAPRAYRLTGSLNVAALQSALDSVVARHEIFRTRIAEVAGEARQLIGPPVAVPLQIHDLLATPSELREAELRRSLGEAARVPFDLGRDTLLRAHVFVLGENESALLLLSHHIASDGWSRNVLNRELAVLYAAACAGQQGALPPVSVQYGDHAAWQEQRLQGSELLAQLAWWRNNLDGAPAVLELPIDKARPAAPTFDGMRRFVDVDAGTARALAEIGRPSGASLFMVLLAAHATMIYRLTGQRDMVIGVPVAGRGHPDLEGVIGYLTNTLPIRLKVSGETRFVDLVDQVRTTCLEAFERQDVPFEMIAAEAQRGRANAHAPIFQTMFTLHDQNPVELELTGLTIQPLAFETGWAKLDLVFDVAKQGDGSLGLMLTVRADLFASISADRMLARAAMLLGSIAATPGAAIAELAMIPEAERDLLLNIWNDTAVAQVPGVTLHGLIRARAAATPAAVALQWDDSTGGIAQMSFGDLIQRAERVAAGLRALGVSTGDAVGVCAERSPALVVGMLGAMLAGAHYVPLDAEYPADRLRFMLRDAGVRVLLTHRATQSVASGLGDPTVALHDIDQLANTPSTAAPAELALPEDLAYTIYTSGSTGQPKGVMIPHRAVVNYLGWMARAYNVTSADAILQKAPASFDACIWEFFLPLVTGARMVLSRPGASNDAEYLLRAVARHGITILQAVPTQLRMMLEATESDPATVLGGMRQLVLGGEALPGDLLAEVRRLCPALPIANLYGPTEATVYSAAWNAPAGTWTAASVPVGQPIDNTTIHIVDGLGRLLPIGVPGELCIGGLGVARGYHGRAELTAERFIPDPFVSVAGARLYRTGDLARRSPDGTLEYLGRIDTQVKVRGHRIELGEIEHALKGVAGVRDAAVTVRTDPRGSAALVAYVVTEGTSGGASLWRGELAQRVPGYMVPVQFVTLERLPMNANGKLDRAALPEPSWEVIARVRIAPRNATERAVAAIWVEVLQSEDVGVTDGFLDLGGHSLLAMRVVARIKQQLGAAIPLGELMRGASVADIATLLDATIAAGIDASNDEPVLAPVARGGYRRGVAPR